MCLGQRHFGSEPVSSPTVAQGLRQLTSSQTPLGDGHNGRAREWSCPSLDLASGLPCLGSLLWIPASAWLWNWEFLLWVAVLAHPVQGRPAPAPRVLLPYQGRELPGMGSFCLSRSCL